MPAVVEVECCGVFASALCRFRVLFSCPLSVGFVADFVDFPGAILWALFDQWLDRVHVASG